jgi:hypothetical protein
MAPRSATQRRWQNNFCCVTTRRRNLRIVRGLWQRLGAATARTFGLGMLGFDRIFLTPFGLPPRRVPTPDHAQAFRVLAVTLVPTLWLVPAPAAFAQANSCPLSSRTGTSAAVWTIMTGAHGSVVTSQGIARGERANVLLERLLNQKGSTLVCQSICQRLNQTGKETAKETF